MVRQLEACRSTRSTTMREKPISAVPTGASVARA